MDRADHGSRPEPSTIASYLEDLSLTMRPSAPYKLDQVTYLVEQADRYSLTYPEVGSAVFSLSHAVKDYVKVSTDSGAISDVVDSEPRQYAWGVVRIAAATLALKLRSIEKDRPSIMTRRAATRGEESDELVLPLLRSIVWVIAVLGVVDLVLLPVVMLIILFR